MGRLKEWNGSAWVPVAAGTSSTSSIITTTSDITLYIDSANGSDINDGKTQSTPMKTITNAFASLPSIIEHNVTFVLTNSTTTYDTFSVKLSGSGSIMLRSTNPGTVSANLAGVSISSSNMFTTLTGINFTNKDNLLLRLTGCNSFLQNCTFDGTGITSDSTFYAINIFSGNAEFAICRINNISTDVYAIYAQQGASVGVTQLLTSTGNTGGLFYVNDSIVTYGDEQIYTNFGSTAYKTTQTIHGGQIGIGTDSLTVAVDGNTPPPVALMPENAMYPIYTYTQNNWAGIGAYIDGTPWMEFGSTPTNRITTRWAQDGVHVRTGGFSGAFDKFVDYTAPLRGDRTAVNRYVPIVTTSGLHTVNKLNIFSDTNTSSTSDISYELDSSNMPTVSINKPQTGSLSTNSMYTGKFKVLTHADLEAPNMLVNGNFEISQRGDYFNIDNNTPIYTADMWQVQRVTGSQALSVAIQKDTHNSPPYMQLSMSLPTGSNTIRIAQTLPTRLFKSDITHGTTKKSYISSMVYSCPATIVDPIEGTATSYVQPAVSLKVYAVGTANRSILTYSGSVMAYTVGTVGGTSLEDLRMANTTAAYYDNPQGLGAMIEITFTGDGTKDFVFRLYSAKLEDGPRCTGYAGHLPYDINLARCQEYYYIRRARIGTGSLYPSQFLQWSGIMGSNTAAQYSYLQSMMAPTEMNNVTQTAEIGYSIVASSSSFTSSQKLDQVYTTGSPNNNGVIPVPSITIPTGCWMGINYYAINASLT